MATFSQRSAMTKRIGAAHSTQRSVRRWVLRPMISSQANPKIRGKRVPAVLWR